MGLFLTASADQAAASANTFLGSKLTFFLSNSSNTYAKYKVNKFLGGLGKSNILSLKNFIFLLMFYLKLT